MTHTVNSLTFLQIHHCIIKRPIESAAMKYNLLRFKPLRDERTLYLQIWVRPNPEIVGDE